MDVHLPKVRKIQWIFPLKKYMAVTEFNAALNQVATERGIPVEAVIESIKFSFEYNLKI